MNLSTMLDTTEFVSSEEHRFKELPIEARHSICLEISKKRRQSVATSIFIPKELSNHIRFLKRCQRRESNKKTKIKKPMMNDKNTTLSTIAKYKNKYFKRKDTAISQQKKSPQQPKSAYIKHPESYPIPNKLASTVTSERLRTFLEVLREDAAPDAATKQLEIVEQQIPLGTDQNLTISYAVEIPEKTMATNSSTVETVLDNTAAVRVDKQHEATLITDESISEVVPKQEVPDSSYDNVESAAMEENYNEAEGNDNTSPCMESVVSNNNNNYKSESHDFIAVSQPLLIDNNVQQQHPQVSQFENSFKQHDCNILNFYGYQPAPEVKTKEIASSMEQLELQLLKNYQSVTSISHNDGLSHKNGPSHVNETNYTTLPPTFITPAIQQPAAQSINYYHRLHEQQPALDPSTNSFINYNTAQNNATQPPQPTAVPRQPSKSCRHSLHKRHQNYLNYGLQHYSSGLEDPLAVKAWHYTIQKAQARSNRSARRAAIAAARLQQSIEETRTWHYPANGGGTFVSPNAHTHAQQQDSASLPYVPAAVIRPPQSNYYNTDAPYTHPVDLTMYEFYQQSKTQRELPPPYHYNHHQHQHHHQYHQLPHSQYAHHQHSHSQQHLLQPQYNAQQQNQQHYELYHQNHYQQQCQHKQQHPPHYHYAQQQQQLLPTHSFTQYGDGLNTPYPAQIKRLSEPFAHISSTALPQPVTDPSYWYQLQRDLLYDQQNTSALQGITASVPTLSHAPRTYINSNTLF